MVCCYVCNEERECESFVHQSLDGDVLHFHFHYQQAIMD